MTRRSNGDGENDGSTLDDFGGMGRDPVGDTDDRVDPVSAPTAPTRDTDDTGDAPDSDWPSWLVPGIGTPVADVTPDAPLWLEEGGESQVPAVLRDDACVPVGSYLQVPLPEVPPAATADIDATDTDTATGAADRRAVVLCRVARLENPADKTVDTRSAELPYIVPDGDAPDRRRRQVAQLVPICTVVLAPRGADGGGNGRGDGDLRAVEAVPPGRLPRRVTPVFRPTRAVLRAGLDVPPVEDGLPIGRLAHRGRPIPAGDPLVYALPDATTDGAQADPAVMRHIGIYGRSGAGKTTLAKNTVRQVLSGREYAAGRDGTTSQPAVVVIDPTREAQFQGLGAPPGGAAGPEGDSEADLLDGVASGPAPVETFVPAVDTGGTPPVDDPERFRIPFEVVHQTPTLLLNEDTPDGTASALRECVKVFFEGTDGSGKDVPHLTPMSDDRDFATFQQWLRDHDDDGNRSANALRDALDIHSKSYDAMMRRVNDPAVRALFGGDGATGDPSFTDHPAEFVAPGRATVVATGHIRTNRSVELGVVQALLTHLARAKLRSTGGRLAEVPVILVVDEAHRYIRQRESQRSRKVVELMRDVAREGRKSGLGLLAISQRPADIDEEVRSQIATTIAMELGKRQARAVGGDDQRVPRDRLRRLDPGSALVWPPGGQWRELLGFEPLVRHP